MGLDNKGLIILQLPHSVQNAPLVNPMARHTKPALTAAFGQRRNGMPSYVLFDTQGETAVGPGENVYKLIYGAIN